MIHRGTRYKDAMGCASHYEGYLYVDYGLVSRRPGNKKEVGFANSLEFDCVMLARSIHKGTVPS